MAGRQEQGVPGEPKELPINPPDRKIEIYKRVVAALLRSPGMPISIPRELDHPEIEQVRVAVRQPVFDPVFLSTAITHVADFPPTGLLGKNDETAFVIVGTFSINPHGVPTIETITPSGVPTAKISLTDVLPTRDLDFGNYVGRHVAVVGRVHTGDPERRMYEARITPELYFKREMLARTLSDFLTGGPRLSTSDQTPGQSGGRRRGGRKA